LTMRADFSAVMVWIWISGWGWVCFLVFGWMGILAIAICCLPGG